MTGTRNKEWEQAVKAREAFVAQVNDDAGIPFDETTACSLINLGIKTYLMLGVRPEEIAREMRKTIGVLTNG